MRCRSLLASLLLAVAAQSGVPAPTLTFAGYGAIHFGASVKQAAAAVKTAAIRSNPEEDEACHYVHFAAYPGADFMVENGRIVRVEVPDAASNILGVRVGMSLVEIRTHLKGRRFQMREDGDNNQYLVIPAADGKSEIYLALEHDKLAYVRGGLLPAVEYVEGCL